MANRDQNEHDRQTSGLAQTDCRSLDSDRAARGSTTSQVIQQDAKFTSGPENSAQSAVAETNKDKKDQSRSPTSTARRHSEGTPSSNGRSSFAEGSSDRRLNGSDQSRRSPDYRRSSGSDWRQEWMPSRPPDHRRSSCFEGQRRSSRSPDTWTRRYSGLERRRSPNTGRNQDYYRTDTRRHSTEAPKSTSRSSTSTATGERRSSDLVEDQKWSRPRSRSPKHNFKRQKHQSPRRQSYTSTSKDSKSANCKPGAETETHKTPTSNQPLKRSNSNISTDFHATMLKKFRADYLSRPGTSVTFEPLTTTPPAEPGNLIRPQVETPDQKPTPLHFNILISEKAIFYKTVQNGHSKTQKLSPFINLRLNSKNEIHMPRPGSSSSFETINVIKYLMGTPSGNTRRYNFHSTSGACFFEKILAMYLASKILIPLGMARNHGSTVLAAIPSTMSSSGRDQLLTGFRRAGFLIDPNSTTLIQVPTALAFGLSARNVFEAGLEGVKVFAYQRNTSAEVALSHVSSSGYLETITARTLFTKRLQRISVANMAKKAKIGLSSITRMFLYVDPAVKEAGPKNPKPKVEWTVVRDPKVVLDGLRLISDLTSNGTKEATEVFKEKFPYSIGIKTDDQSHATWLLKWNEDTASKFAKVHLKPGENMQVVTYFGEQLRGEVKVVQALAQGRRNPKFCNRPWSATGNGPEFPSINVSVTSQGLLRLESEKKDIPWIDRTLYYMFRDDGDAGEVERVFEAARSTCSN